MTKIRDGIDHQEAEAGAVFLKEDKLDSVLSPISKLNLSFTLLLVF